MKIIKSKYPSEELQRIYDEAESKVEKDVVKKIKCCSRILDMLYVILAWISIGLVAGLFSFNTGKAVGDMVIAFLDLTAIALILWFFVSHFGVSRLLLFRFYEKRGHILENPLDDCFFSCLIKAIKAGEEITKLLNEHKWFYLYKDEMFLFLEPNNSEMKVVKEIEVYFEYQLTESNPDALDFSCFDEEIAEAIVTTRKHLENKIF